VEELLVAAALLPMAFTDLRAGIDGLVTVSDASEEGGGACVSSGVADPSISLLDDRVAGGQRTTTRPRVLVIGLFDGAGGLRVSLGRLPVDVVGYISSEIDKEARRLVRVRWAGVIEWGDLTRVSREVVSSTAAAFAKGVDCIVVGAGSPCQDPSSLRLNRERG
jgi:hypothetical protein